jgi:hypothetical protein
MARSDELTGLFEFPALRTHCDFEICRVYFLEWFSAKEIGQRFQRH